MNKSAQMMNKCDWNKQIPWFSFFYFPCQFGSFSCVLLKKTCNRCCYGYIHNWMIPYTLDCIYKFLCLHIAQTYSHLLIKTWIDVSTGFRSYIETESTQYYTIVFSNQVPTENQLSLQENQLSLLRKLVQKPSPLTKILCALLFILWKNRTSKKPLPSLEPWLKERLQRQTLMIPLYIGLMTDR